MTLDPRIPPPPTAMNHHNIYTTLLGVLGFLVTIAILTLNAMRQTVSAESRAALLIPLTVEGCFLAMIVLGLLIRLAFPAHRRWPTLGLNIILLLLFPLGTALAIYGLWKLDRDQDRDEISN